MFGDSTRRLSAVLVTEPLLAGSGCSGPGERISSTNQTGSTDEHSRDSGHARTHDSADTTETASKDIDDYCLKDGDVVDIELDRA